MSGSNSSSSISNESNPRRCAACRYLRRRCAQDCILSPHFPPSNPQRFACVHRIFGASNVARMLQQLPDQQRAQAADAIATEAYWRVRDPVYGSVGIISQLQKDIYVHQHELALTRAQIAIHTAQQQQQQQQYDQAQSRNPPSHPQPPHQTQTQTHQTQSQAQQLDPLAIMDGRRSIDDFSNLSDFF